jgi:hypothetical protein
MLLNRKLTILFFLLTLNIFSQIDTNNNIHKVHRDTHYIITENPVKNKFIGNSWYISAAYTKNKKDEFNFGIGRTYGTSYGSGIGEVYNMSSWGFGYGFYNSKNHQVNAFWEGCMFWVPPFSVGIRGEYIYDFTNQANYLRPSLGFSFFFFDVFYSYSFNLNRTENQFKHGVTFRIKYYHKIKNWEKKYPNEC